MSPASAPVRVVILGATGRMGLSLVRELPAFASLSLHAAVASPGNSAVGRDSGELAGMAPNAVPIRTDLAAALEGAGLALDFSAAAAAGAHVRACAAAKVPVLLGTTGLGPEAISAVAEAARLIPVLVTANTSFGVTVLLELVRTAAAALGAGFDIRIRDVHHAGKRDAPSGTSLALGAAAAQAAGLPPQRINYESERRGEVVGEHQIQFIGPGESLCLGHSATDRAVFARGALRAGRWLARRPPGRYDMGDVLREK
ncbi:MAG TPA: 4-hydroxy-tetrahydrodipicolinate reductase [Steroidobacteraceae bacterium]|nr:4-hydroxy-tetrahydrodipicolinate reductase [Steroidobacteraceae bacterium]